MAAQWQQQGQQTHYYQHPQTYQTTLHHPQVQQYQQPQYQQAQQFPQNGQYHQASPQQYQQPAQQYSQTQPYQQQGQYPQVQQHSQVQSYQQPPQHYTQAGQYSQAQTPQQPVQQHPQAVQYSQAGQYSPTQSYQHSPQQYSQAQHQTHNTFQQQYTSQQPPSQQFQAQQHASIPSAAYQQPYQLQASSTNVQVPAAVNTSSCFNCGAPNHFAQNCPEPKRATPAGALEPCKFANPLKRVKHGGAIVTKFSPPVHNSQVQGYSQGYPPSTYGQSGQTQYQESYNAATPNSAQNQAHQEAWQQYYQWQAYQQNQQQQQHPGAAYQSHSSHAPGSQTSPYSYGLEQPNQVSAEASYSDPASQSYQIEHPQSRPQQLPERSAPSDYTQNYAPTSPGFKASCQRQESITSISGRIQDLPKSPQKGDSALEEPEEDDLTSLDVPDLPMGLPQDGDFGHLPNTIVSPPAALISMPLPANFVVADALYPIPPPGPGDDGRCQSKYLRDVTSESLCENIKSSKYWRDHKDDTVFLVRPDNETVRPLDEICAQIKQRHAHGEADGRETRSQSRSASVRKDSVDVLTQVEKLEREIAEMKAKMLKKSLAKGELVTTPVAAAEASPIDRYKAVKEERATPPQSVMAERVMKSSQDTEDILAALGVTGSPKPVTVPNGTPNCLRLDSRHEWNAESLQRDHRTNGLISYSSGFGFPPPPPPPPPQLQQPSLPEQMDGSPTSAGLGHLNGYAFNANGIDHGNGYQNTEPIGEILSPDDPRHQHQTSRKRSHNHRDSSSEEEDAPARRQEDDVTPKLKRRQPKVAAAYSRRW